MNTVSHAFDSRSMVLLEPTTAPSAFSLWRWLGDRIGAKASTRWDARAPRDQAHELTSEAPRLATDPGAADRGQRPER
jgi:hypothetical protein